jgi:hypothetical protein
MSSFCTNFQNWSILTFTTEQLLFIIVLYIQQIDIDQFFRALGDASTGSINSWIRLCFLSHLCMNGSKRLHIMHDAEVPCADLTMWSSQRRVRSTVTKDDMMSSCMFVSKGKSMIWFTAMVRRDGKQ